MTPDSPTTGALPRLVAAVCALFGLAWLTWPIWSSHNVADRATRAALNPWLLGALLALMALLGTVSWLATGRRPRFGGGALLLAAAGALVPTVLHPGASGVEFSYVFGLVAGVLLGAPLGFLTGGVAALMAAVVAGTVADPLVGQVTVWGMWGLVGGLLRPLATGTAWALASVLCVPLGLLTGVLLNLTGWVDDAGADVGAFLPGLGPWESLLRLLQYTGATSLLLDLTRGLVSAAAMAAVGGPLLYGLRQGQDARWHPVAVILPPVGLSRRALARRSRDERVENLWQALVKGDPNE